MSHPTFFCFGCVLSSLITVGRTVAFSLFVLHWMCVIFLPLHNSLFVQSENLFQPGSLHCCSCILFASALEQPAVEKHLQAKYWWSWFYQHPVNIVLIFNLWNDEKFTAWYISMEEKKKTTGYDTQYLNRRCNVQKLPVLWQP